MLVLWCCWRSGRKITPKKGGEKCLKCFFTRCFENLAHVYYRNKSIWSSLMYMYKLQGHSTTYRIVILIQSCNENANTLSNFYGFLRYIFKIHSIWWLVSCDRHLKIRNEGCSKKKIFMKCQICQTHLEWLALNMR